MQLHSTQEKKNQKQVQFRCTIAKLLMLGNIWCLPSSSDRGYWDRSLGYSAIIDLFVDLAVDLKWRPDGPEACQQHIVG